MPEDLNAISDADLEKQVQDLDAQIAALRAQKKARVEVLAARGEKAHRERMAKGNVITVGSPKPATP